MSGEAIPFLSVEEYLRIERKAEFKSEYHDGQMFAMSGGSLAHSRIPMNLAVALAKALGDRDCCAASSDLRVRITPRGPFVYPDVTVFCGEPQLADDYRDILLNPTVIFEVISESSEACDRGQIRLLPPNRLAARLCSRLANRAKVEIFSKDTEGRRGFTAFDGLDATCRLPGIDCELQLADIYRHITFAPATTS